MSDDRLYDVLLRIAVAVEKLIETTSNTETTTKRKRTKNTDVPPAAANEIAPPDVIDTVVNVDKTGPQPEYQRFVAKPNRFNNVLPSTPDVPTAIESLLLEEAKVIGAATISVASDIMNNVSAIQDLQTHIVEHVNTVKEDDVTEFIESTDCFEKLRNRTLVCYNRDMTRIFDALKAANVKTFNALRENKDNLRIFVQNLIAEERIQGIK